MASENSKQLQKAFVSALNQRGFTKTGATWRKASADVISVLNLQGSQWKPSFYINLGVYFRALGDSDKPAEYDCHVRAPRLTDLVPDRDWLNALLDFEKPVQEHVRVREIEILIVEHALPWLDRVSSIEGAREYCRCLGPRSPWITKETRAFLAIGPDTR